MTAEQLETYIKEELNSEPRHDCEALSLAISDIAEEVGHNEFEIMRLLLENIEIPALYTHSYGFHTANGREIINAIKNKYYEYESTS
jgi:hypothetical protein